MLDLLHRPRRLRRTPALRAMVRQTSLQTTDLIYPLFVHEGARNEAIASMPGCQRWCLDALGDEVGRAWDLGIHRLKGEHPDMAIMTDVALDPYSSDGHDGIVSPHGVVLNDETVEILCQQALAQARSGADPIGPSDMMDGRVEAIRTILQVLVGLLRSLPGCTGFRTSRQRR